MSPAHSETIEPRDDDTSREPSTRRRRGFLAPALIGLGVLLLALAALLPTLVLSQVKKTPLDPATTTSVAEGKGKIFDSATNSLKEYDNIQATRLVSIDTKASDGDIAVFQATLCVRSEPKTGAANECDMLKDPKLLSFSCDRVATKRYDAVAVNDKKYFENANNESSDCIDKDGKPIQYRDHQGLTYKFPFDVTPDGTYRMNDDNGGGSVKAEYQGKEKIQGVEVLHFVADFPASKTKIKGIFPGTVQNTVDYWVEPTTGMVIKGSQHQVQKFENGDTAADVQLDFTKDNVDKNIAKAKDSLGLLNIVKIWAPLGAGLLGLLLLAAGLILMKKQRDDRREDDDAYDYEPPAAYANR